jgi:hypothetical protein
MAVAEERLSAWAIETTFGAGVKLCVLACAHAELANALVAVSLPHD